MNDPSTTQDKVEPIFELNQFFPYQLSNFDSAVSQSMSQLYHGRFKLNRQEWRILAVLGANPPMSAKAIASTCKLEKMPVSRGISRLTDTGLIQRQEDSQDRRYSRLSLTDEGRSIYKKLVPLILAREAFILSALSSEEQQQLQDLMTKVRQKAEELQLYG